MVINFLFHNFATMVVYNKLNLKRHLITKINYYVWGYKNHFDIESIHFNNSIDGVEHIKIYPYSNQFHIKGWHDLSALTLAKIYHALKRKDFYGWCRTSNGNMVKITPKKNDKL